VLDLPRNTTALARLAEQAVAGKPNAALRRCEDKEPHEGHYWGEGMKRRWCGGLKTRARVTRGVPRAEWVRGATRGSTAESGGSAI
jgi:hypothetical protein